MYLTDPRENSICPKEGTIWESDNRIEERWHWNGAALDLCNMDPEEYGTTIFYTADAPQKEPTSGKNAMVLELNDEGKGSVSMANPPASDVYMLVEDEDGNVDVVVIPEGSESPFEFDFVNVNVNSIKNVFIGPDEDNVTSNTFSDETYKYIISYKAKPAEEVMYAAIKHATVGEEGLLTKELISYYCKKAVVKGKCSAFAYVIQPIAIPGLDTMSDEAAEKVFETEQVDLFILTTAKTDHIFLNNGEEQTSSWDLNYDVATVDGRDYYVSRFSLSEHTNLYDPEDQVGADVIYTYKVVMG